MKRAPPPAPEPPDDEQLDDEQLDDEQAALLDAGDREDDEPVEREGPVEREAGPLSDAECSRALRADALKRFKKQLAAPARSPWVTRWKD